MDGGLGNRVVNLNVREVQGRLLMRKVFSLKHSGSGRAENNRASAGRSSAGAEASAEEFGKCNGRNSEDSEPASRDALNEEAAGLALDDSFPSGAAAAFTAPDVRWGVASALGGRASMEDTHVAVQHLQSGFSDAPLGEERSFFAVYDGHGGTAASEFARDHMLDLLLKSPDFIANPGHALNSTFTDLDDLYFEAVRDGASRPAGTTAITALLCGAQLLVANAGDSRAVLCRRGRAIELSTDHKPSSATELLRIRTADGYVCPEGYVNGQLGVSRAIGDFHFEGLKYKTNGYGPTKGPLTAEPEISINTLVAEDEFMIVACDGLWDVVNSQRAVEIARVYLQTHANDPEACAQALVDHAIKASVADNVTVIVVCLIPHRPPKREVLTSGMARVPRSVSKNALETLTSALSGL